MEKYHIEETVTHGQFGNEGPESGALLRGNDNNRYQTGRWRYVRKGTRNLEGSIQGNGRERVAWFDPVLPASDNWADAWLALDAIAGIWNSDENFREYRLIVGDARDDDYDTLHLRFSRCELGIVHLQFVEVETGGNPRRTLHFLELAANRTEAILAWLEGVAERVAATQAVSA